MSQSTPQRALAATPVLLAFGAQTQTSIGLSNYVVIGNYALDARRPQHRVCA